MPGAQPFDDSVSFRELLARDDRAGGVCERRAPVGGVGALRPDQGADQRFEHCGIADYPGGLDEIARQRPIRRFDAFAQVVGGNAAAPGRERLVHGAADGQPVAAATRTRFGLLALANRADEAMERRERRGPASFGDEAEDVVGIRRQSITGGLPERGHRIARGHDLLVLDERTNGWVRIPAEPIDERAQGPRGQVRERGDGRTANRQRLFRIEREAGRDVEHRGPARRIEQRARNAQARDADVRVGIPQNREHRRDRRGVAAAFECPERRDSRLRRARGAEQRQEIPERPGADHTQPGDCGFAAEVAVAAVRREV